MPPQSHSKTRASFYPSAERLAVLFFLPMGGAAVYRCGKRRLFHRWLYSRYGNFQIKKSGSGSI
jgi:hypothetical protein